MKLRSFPPAALVLAAPLLMVLSLLMPLACGSSSSGSTSATPQPTTGNVEIGLVDAPSLSFQNLLLNLISVRLNPAKNATDATGGWVSIPAPAGVGGPVGSGLLITNFSTGGQFFNTNNPETNPGTSELQIDLNDLQNNVMIFNIAGVPPQTYHTVQLKIDPNIPGSVVPNCASVSSPATEGCIAFPVKVASTAALATTSTIPVKNGKLTTLVLEIALPTPPSPPNSNGGKYSIAPQVSLVPDSTSSPSVNSLMALVQGSVSGIPSGVHENVVVEPAGTSNQIITAKVRGGKYVMQVPVAQNGTNYDLFAFGAGNSYDILTPAQSPPAQPLMRGANYIVNFTVKSAKTGKLTGVVSDACPGGGGQLSPIEGATVNLLAPTGNADCSVTPAACVVVATTSTNILGQYPTAGRTGLPQPFNFVPTSTGTYAIQISASGFDTLRAPVMSSAGKVTCPSTPSHKCSFSLTHSTITGTVSISPAQGTTAEVQVFAEATGTNDIVSALTAPLAIPACGSPPCQARFSINVPATGPASFDLFATSIDLFNGAPDPYTSHTYAIVSDVPTPAQCQAAAAPSNLALNCAGHGSISGTVNLPFDEGTTVRLFKFISPSGPSVQVAQSPVGAFGSTNAGAYSFCAPADTYEVERAENDVLQPPAVEVIVPTPAPTATPCLQCTSSGVCPGNCSNTDGPTL